MDDEKIISLFFERNETAIKESERKYGAYVQKVIENILGKSGDSAECLNDALLKLWNSIPPEKPVRLKFFFAKIARNTALDRLRLNSSVKRGAGEAPLLFSELEECVCGGSVSGEAEMNELYGEINSFLYALPVRERGIFLHRYFYAESISDIARFYSLSAGHTKVILSRTRRKLKDFLSERGY